LQAAAKPSQFHSSADSQSPRTDVVGTSAIGQKQRAESEVKGRHNVARGSDVAMNSVHYNSERQRSSSSGNNINSSSSGVRTSNTTSNRGSKTSRQTDFMSRPATQRHQDSVRPVTAMLANDDDDDDEALTTSYDVSVNESVHRSRSSHSIAPANGKRKPAFGKMSSEKFIRLWVYSIFLSETFYYEHLLWVSL